jgi:hypothetical protein
MTEERADDEEDNVADVDRRVGHWPLVMSCAFRIIHGSVVNNPGYGLAAGMGRTGS